MRGKVEFDEVISMELLEVAQAHTAVKGRRMTEIERQIEFSSEVKSILGKPIIADEEVNRFVLATKEKAVRDSLSTCMKTVDTEISSPEVDLKIQSCRDGVKEKLKDFGDHLNNGQLESVIRDAAAVDAVETRAACLEDASISPGDKNCKTDEATKDAVARAIGKAPGKYPMVIRNLLFALVKKFVASALKVCIAKGVKSRKECVSGEVKSLSKEVVDKKGEWM